MQRKLFIEISDAVDPQISIARYKYNLPLAMPYHVDDGIIEGAERAQQLWDVIGCSYPDGCGNRIEYMADVAVNINAGNIERFVQLIINGGSILNHSEKHTGENPLAQLEAIYNYYLNEIDYKVAGVVAPGAEDYGQASIDHREPFITSANDDTFGVLKPKRVYLYMSENPDDSDPLAINRQLTNFDSDEIIELYKTYLDKPRTEVNCMPISTHASLSLAMQPNVDRFIDFYEYIKDNYSEETLVCSMREYVDYILMCKIDIDFEVVGSTMIVTIDDGSIRLLDKICWFDNCLNVTGATTPATL